MRTFLFCFFTLAFITVKAQSPNISLKKGVVLEDIEILDSDGESLALYLPTNFNLEKKWPILFIMDYDGNAKKALRMFVSAAEKQNYILAAPNNLLDSLSLSENVLAASRMMDFTLKMLPVNNQQLYTAGFSEGAKLASVIPVIIKNIKGVISVGEPMGNTDVLSPNNSFHFIGIVASDSYNLIEMKETERVLNGYRFPNELFVYEEGASPNSLEYMEKSLAVFSLEAMSKNVVDKNKAFIQENYTSSMSLVDRLIAGNKLISADKLLTENRSIYRGLLDVDAIKSKQKQLRKNKVFKTQKRSAANYAFQESLLREDFDYALYEDVLTYNFNNLGWWNYQMQELNKKTLSNNPDESLMGKRLISFVNHLTDSTVEELKVEPVLDEEGLSFLWMLKTLTNPKDYVAYKNIISYSSKTEDYPTALFYLEELLKAGYQDTKELYEIENTALLRITPEYNQLIEKYLKDARYEIIEQ